MLADGGSPLDALIGPVAHDGERFFGHHRASGGNRETARIQGNERQLQSLAESRNDVFFLNFHVLESQKPVLYPFKTHKTAAVNHFETRCPLLDDESSNLGLFFSVDDLGRGFRQDRKSTRLNSSHSS